MPRSDSRSRSASPRRHVAHKSSTRGRSRGRALPPGTAPISDDDYFLKSAEFARWLREEKGKVRTARSPAPSARGV